MPHRRAGPFQYCHGMKWKHRFSLTHIYTESHLVNLLPDYIHSSGPYFRVAAHNRDASGKWTVNAKDDTLHPPWQDRQECLCACLVTPARKQWHEQRSGSWSSSRCGMKPEINLTARSCSPSALRVRVLRVPIECLQIMPLRQPWEHGHFGYITSNLQSPIDLLDNHFDGVDPHGQFLAFGDGVGHSATVVGHLGV